MKRSDCLKAIYPQILDKLVVTIMGATAQELYDLGDRENFFYLKHAMGLASSIGSAWRSLCRTKGYWCWTVMGRS